MQECNPSIIVDHRSGVANMSNLQFDILPGIGIHNRPIPRSLANLEALSFSPHLQPRPRLTVRIRPDQSSTTLEHEGATLHQFRALYRPVSTPDRGWSELSKYLSTESCSPDSCLSCNDSLLLPATSGGLLPSRPGISQRASLGLRPSLGHIVTISV